MTEGTIRAARPEDLPAMRRIVARRSDIAMAVSGWVGRSWVYLLDANVIAFASRGCGDHQLHAFYVAARLNGARVRGTGHGSIFLRLVEEEIGRGSAFIELFVERNNPKAKRFYLRNGYEARRALSGWTMSKCFREPPSLEDGRPI